MDPTHVLVNAVKLYSAFAYNIKNFVTFHCDHFYKFQIAKPRFVYIHICILPSGHKNKL